MGHGIAQVFAQGGCHVRLVDIDPGILQQAEQQIASNLQVMVEGGVLADFEIEPTCQRIETSTDLDASASDVDLAIDAMDTFFRKHGGN